MTVILDNRFATALDTAQILAVPTARAKRLANLVVGRRKSNSAAFTALPHRKPAKFAKKTFEKRRTRAKVSKRTSR